MTKSKWENMTVYNYPRRQAIRWVMHQLARPALALFAQVEVLGEENLPREGPLIVVGNHFCFLDPVAFVRFSPWPIDFIGAAFPPFAPPWTKMITAMWGFYKLYRGTGSTEALRAAEALLAQNGILGIFPEGGSWATVLRPARPGTAYLAARSGASLLPVGLYGFNDVFPPRLRHRARPVIKIGETFGPFSVTGRGRKRREQLDEIGHTIMRKIAELLPEELRGSYSEDPTLREAAIEFEAFPWDENPEGKVDSGGVIN